MIPLIMGAHFVAGLLVGVAYFRALWWNAQLFAAGGRVSASIAVMAGRFALLGGVLVLAGREGALPLLLLALGVLTARFAVMRHVRRAVA